MKTNIKNDDYLEELSDLECRMKQAEAFAKKIPVFASEILSRKVTGKEEWVKFTERYKSLYLAWGVNRGLYETGTTRTVTNHKGQVSKQFLFCIYVNTLNVFDTHSSFGLDKVPDTVPVFFYDELNSTFYATDDQIAALLDALHDWYERAKVMLVESNKEKEIADLKGRLERLEG